MVSLLKSATKTLPVSSAATPHGFRNRALAPVPSRLPGWPASPAKVLTAPFGGVIFRMVLLAIPATKTLPAPSTATPKGAQNRASLPVPSALPWLPVTPAKVLTTPLDAIFRIVLLPVSTTEQH